MKYVKDIHWLKGNIDKAHVKVLDCRFSLKNPIEGRKQYAVEHIPGAVYFDLEKDLSGHIKKHGGRHPLPNMKNFLRKIEEAGIENDTTIIAYDFNEGAYAGRCWWLFRYLGHKNVYVLNGGIKAWKEAGFTTDSIVPTYRPTSYKPSFNEKIVSSQEEIKGALNGARNVTIIDSRNKERYLGIEEPIDRIPGHIPGAINAPWTEGVQGGYFLSVEEQKKRFEHLNKNEPVIVYCGSGVTATPNFMALEEAGFQDVKLYVGSYSDWVSYEGNRVEKKSQ
ncbi:sulfurtransferase [Rossellomorea aquimaris]|uniref:sulfurtransferase n=1 Tax=Rossellomorea aquimaris TaxID=189382 RepID=UPI0007D09479|nr:sulfurtransferase [Rossellomorea aquimaris]